MLNQTKRTIDELMAAGFERGQISVRTPYDRRRQCYGRTQVRLTNSNPAGNAELTTTRLLRLVRQVPFGHHVVVFLHNGVPGPWPMVMPTDGPSTVKYYSVPVECDPCDTCGGAGHIDGHLCGSCNGAGRQVRYD